MNRKFLFWAASLAFAPLSATSAGTVSLNPAKDNTLIQQTSPASQLSNGQGDIFVGRTNQDGQGTATISIRRGLIAFDVAGNIPVGAVITSVSLTMRDVMGLNGDPVVELHRLLQDWGEGASFQNGGMGAAAQNNDATWLYTFYNAANPASSPAWTTPGGSFSSTVSGSAVVLDDLGGGQLFTWSSSSNAQMIADVQGWLDDPSTNFGWLLLGDESRGQSAKRFNSGESTIAPNVAPVLTIEYSLVPESPGLALASLAAGVATVFGKRRRRIC